MVKLHRLKGGTIVINLEVIATLEATPDTLVTLLNGDKYLVRDRVDDIIQQAIDYRHSILQTPPVIAPDTRDV